MLDTLDALDALAKRKREWMREWRAQYDQYVADLRRYRAKLRGEDWQLELGEVRNED